MTNFDMDRLLADAADDTGEPLRRSLDDVVRRGRRRVRRRQAGTATAGLLAVGAVVSGSALWPSPDGGGYGLDLAPAASPTAATHAPRAKATAPPPPVATMSDQDIIRRCKPLDEQFRRVSENKARGGSDPIANWTVHIKQAPPGLIHAVLLSPDGKRRAYCVFDARTGARNDYNREAFERPDYKIFTGGINGAVDRVPDKVARVTFETPDGVVNEARIKDHIVLWFNGRHVDLGKPIWATFYDAAGKQLARFNAIGKPVTCGPDTRGPTVHCG